MVEQACVAILTYHKHTSDHLRRCLNSLKRQASPFEFSVFIVVNSLDPTYFSKVKEEFGNEILVFETESDGYTGKGMNSVYDIYRSNFKDDYSHLMVIDGDDYYYPMAFQCINELQRKTQFDYLSGMCPFVDSLRSGPPPDGRPAIELPDDLWIWSFHDYRVELGPYLYWNGESIPGGEVTHCVSNKAVDCNLKCLEGPNKVDDYFFLLRGIAAHLRGELVFVNTDCNDIYVYDCSGEGITRGENDFDPVKGWPFDKAGLVEREVKKEEFKVLKGITRLHLPYASLEQAWGPERKAEYVLENRI